MKIEWVHPLFSFGPFNRVKRLQNASTTLIFKNWLDTRPEMKTRDPYVYPTILGGVSQGFWSLFLDFQVPKNGSLSAQIFVDHESRISIELI